MCNMDQLTLCVHQDGSTSISQPHTQATYKWPGYKTKVLAITYEMLAHKRPGYGALCPYLRSLDVRLLGSPCTPWILHKENKQANGTMKMSQGFTHGHKLLNTENQILWFSGVHILSY